MGGEGGACCTCNIALILHNMNICVFQRTTDSEISGNTHTSKTSVNIIEIQKKETDMSTNDPPSALITESDYDDDDDSLFNSEIDQDGAIGKAIHSMEIIKSEQNQRTTDGFVTSKFRKSAFLLLGILSYVIDKKSCEEKTDMLQRLTKHSIEYQLLTFTARFVLKHWKPQISRRSL